MRAADSMQQRAGDRRRRDGQPRAALPLGLCWLHLGPARAERGAPRSNAHFARMVEHTCTSNETLMRYFFPEGERSASIQQNWQQKTDQCVRSDNCYCGHVRGSKDKQSNPVDELLRRDRTVGGACESTGSQNLMKRLISRTSCTKRFLAKRCKCWTGRGNPCLYSDMKPATSIVLMAVAREAGVDHIIEEGREGGLSAYIYHLHGFRVTSVEYLPEDEPTAALRAMAPQVAIVDGDGSKLIPKMVDAMSPQEAARTMVIFDGEKRVQAHTTFKKIRDRVAFAAFDDSELPAFREYLDAQEEVWFETEVNATGRYLGLLNQWQAMPDINNTKRIQFKSHTTLVRGGAWPTRRDVADVAAPRGQFATRRELGRVRGVGLG